MSLWSDVRERVRALMFRRREDAALEEELAFHLEMETEKNRRRGMSPAESVRRARIALGGEEQVKEKVRDARGTRLLEDLKRDVGLAVRMLGKRREYTAVVLAVLAFGIGANAATFSVVDALLLRELPVPEPGRLVAIGDPMMVSSVTSGVPRVDVVSYPLFRDVQEGTEAFSGLYATGRTDRLDVFLDGTAAEPGAEAAHPAGRFVSGEFFPVLRVGAIRGRVFGPEDDRLASPGPVAVASHSYAVAHLGGPDGAVGRTLSVNGVPLTVVGVTPESFTGDIVGGPVDLWMPLTLQPTLVPSNPWLDDRGVSWLLMMGRLAPGATIEQARFEVGAIERRSILANLGDIDRTSAERVLRENPGGVASGARGFSLFRGTLGRPLLTLMAAVALLLLVSCANVASLTLVRATARRREMGVRMALGAGRARIVRQLLAESLVLAMLGGMLGLLLARWGATLLVRLANGGPAPFALDVRLNAGVIGLTAVVSLGTAVLFGILPALRASRAPVASELRTRGRRAAGGPSLFPGRASAGQLLVIAQVAVSMVLLVGTGMLLRSMQNLRAEDLGFDRAHTLVVRIDGGRAGFQDEGLLGLRRELVERVAGIPGIVAASSSENGIFGGRDSGSSVTVHGFEAVSENDTHMSYDVVGPGYFETIGARLVQGRDIVEHDDEAAPPVAVVNSTAADFYYGDGPALGRQLTLDGITYEVVGVVSDAEQQGLRREPERRLYLPIDQVTPPDGRFHVIARSTGDPVSVADAVKQVVLDAAPALPVPIVEPVQERISGSLAQDRMVMLVVTFFGGLAMVLAAVGLYGLMAYATACRRSEFGVRMAIGAGRQGVTWMILREALQLMLVGAVIGLPAALAATRMLKSQLYGIGAVDLPSVAVATGTLMIGALVAGVVPGIRAARVSPLEALRGE